MDTMTPIRPALRGTRSISLAARPAAVAEARSQIRQAIRGWEVPVDPAIAVLLTSELVTNAIRHTPSETVTLTITCARDRLRVDVHDTSLSLPTPLRAPADAEAGRGLMLVASLSANWGYYRTPAGKAVYFSLAFPSDRGEGGDRGEVGDRGEAGDRSPQGDRCYAW